MRSDESYTASLQYRIDYRRSYLVLLGETINLTCPYTTPFYKWTPSAQTSWILSEDQVYSLKADSLAVSGRYICSAVNGFGHNSAEFNIKVIDKFSPALEQSCALLSNGHVSKAGPCFLNTYTEPELVLNKVWGEDTILDCESVAVESLTDRITYTWEFYRHPQTSTANKAVVGGGGGSSGNPVLLPAEPSSGDVFLQGSQEANDAFIAQRLPRMSPSPPDGGVPEKVVKTSHDEIVARFTGPILQFRKVTLSHAGEYRCMVSVDTMVRTTSNVADGALEPNIGKLMRTFRLRVQCEMERNELESQFLQSSASFYESLRELHLKRTRK
ncbi:unnamed protein product [Schistocephalus solidus]|uniref:Ig-like domain-containing protein n=1 Tax=Schistocephalus solidus TaxID=70667 RepID=A0A183SWR0_SCHSO|nr:unnamed protein product [Schistocephalus solidus]